YARAPWTARTREALRALAFAAALTAFWTLPLLFRLAETRALAWGTLSTAPFTRPLPVVLATLALAGLLDRTPARGERLALWWLPAAAVMTALDHLALERLGIRWLPADRVVHGTFTHPSPIAALVYRGDAGRGAITQLAEQLDGRTLFGERLEALDPARFSTQADRLGIVAVVALEDDDTQLGWLAESTAFRRRLTLAPFVVFARESAVALPTARDGAWRITLAGQAGGWTSARVAYS